jgi:arylsulfatase A-like enzyme
MPDRPNVLVVLPDQHRQMATAVAGNTDVQTPTLERLADEGVHCPNAYANTPVCTPSRGTFVTGQYPHRHGACTNDFQVAPDAPSVGEAFADAGYQTAWVGKWHLDGVPRDKFTPPGPRRQGFDDWATYNCHLDFFDGHYYRDDDEQLHFDDYEPIALTDMAIEFLDEQSDDDAPFFLVVSPHPPHGPYEDVPERYKDLYDADDLELRPNVEAPDEWAGALADYYAHVTAVDEQVGRLADWLDDHDTAEDTVMLYTSDHGDMLGAHGYFGKSQPYEEAINVPFICRYPDGLPADETVETPVSIVDVAPTLCSLASIGELPGTQGTDLAGALRGDDSDAPDSVFLSYAIPTDNGARQDVPAWRGVRTDRYTYARRGDGTPWLCFDNERDPYQQENLVEDDDASDLVERLDAQLDEWVERTGDPDGTGAEYMAALGETERWNDRERAMHPNDPQLIE